MLFLNPNTDQIQNGALLEKNIPVSVSNDTVA